MSFKIEIDKATINTVLRGLDKLPKKIKDSETKKIMRRQMKPLVPMMRANISPPAHRTRYWVRYTETTRDGVTLAPMNRRVRVKKVTIGPVVRRYKYQAKIGGRRNRIRGRRPGAKTGGSRIYDIYAQGNLVRSIAVRTPRKKYTSGPGVHMWVGRRVGKTNPFDAWYAHMKNKGTKYQRGINFVRKTKIQGGPMVEAGLTKDVKKYILKEAERLGFEIK